MSILIDSNILIYSHNKTSVFYYKAQKFLDKIFKKEKVFLAFQNLLESYVIFTSGVIKPITANQALKIIEFYFYHQLITIIYPTTQTAKIILNLLKKYSIKGVKTHDLTLVALMIENQIGTIFTKNVKDFKTIKGIKVIDPLK